MSETTEKPLAAFINEHKIRMTSRQVDRNPLMPDQDSMDHWRCTLTCAGRRMIITFSKGMGHNGAAPHLPEVLSCMASDSTAMDEDFPEWCREYGYDTDSRRAHQTYQACVKQSIRLRALLGSEETYNDLIHNVERY